MDDLASRLANRVQLRRMDTGYICKRLRIPLGMTLTMRCWSNFTGTAPNLRKAVQPRRMHWSYGLDCHREARCQRFISTSYVERQNLTMRMSMRRFTRLTNGFSKKVENHQHALALYFMYYNFCRVHQTLRVTPAMEAGISDHVWNLSELVGLLRKDAERAA